MNDFLIFLDIFYPPILVVWEEIGLFQHPRDVSTVAVTDGASSPTTWPGPWRRSKLSPVYETLRVVGVHFSRVSLLHDGPTLGADVNNVKPRARQSSLLTAIAASLSSIGAAGADYG